MEANPNGTNNENVNGGISASEPGLDLLHFFGEVCKITQTRTNILSQSVGEQILKVLRDTQSNSNHFERLMKGLCDIAQISTNGKDIRSQNFVEGVLDKVRQDLKLTRVIRNRKKGNRQTQQPKSQANHSNGHLNSSLESSSVEGIEALPEVSQTIPIRTSRKSCRTSRKVTCTTCPQHEIPSLGPALVMSSSSHVTTQVATGAENVTISPAVSPKLSEESHQPGLPLLEDLIQPQITNEAELGTRPLRQPSKRKKKYTKRKPKVSKKKIHIGYNLKNGFYRCSCSSKFKSREGQKKHIRYFNSVWKFNCGRCPRKFFALAKLKQHLNIYHGIDNPLKDYVIGCTLCGIKFKTKDDFVNHRNAEHNIQNVLKQTSRQPAMISGFPHPKPKVVSSQDLKINGERQTGESGMQHQNAIEDDDITEVDVNKIVDFEVINLVSDDEEENQTDAGIMKGNQVESENSTVETSVEISMQNKQRDYGECFGCVMCTEAFRDLKQLQIHLKERHQSARKDVKCCASDSKNGKICGKLFVSCKGFYTHRSETHRASNNEQL